MFFFANSTQRSPSWENLVVTVLKIFCWMADKTCLPSWRRLVVLNHLNLIHILIFHCMLSFTIGRSKKNKFPVLSYSTAPLNCMGNDSVTSFLLNLSTRWKSAVVSTRLPWSLCLWVRTCRQPSERRVDGLQSRSRETGERPLASASSLRRFLSCPVHSLITKPTQL